METLSDLLHQVGIARKQFIASTEGASETQYAFRPTPSSWSMVENVEHMFWAEFGGINGMWKVLEAFRKGEPAFKGERLHHGLSIEKIVEKTWKEKEEVPEVAKPRIGGPLEFWVTSLANLQSLLESLTKSLEGHDLEMIIHPHPISGPLNVIQRYEFLRFHLNRHQKQVENIKAHPNFPKR